jgi:putative ABC transport system ATP-binding protein
MYDAVGAKWTPRSLLRRGARTQDAEAEIVRELVTLERVDKIYRTPAGDFPALRDINLTIGEGAFVSIVGKSGSGKSTLINVITGIDRPTSGDVWVGGTEVSALTEEQIALWRGRTVGVIFQFFQLLPTLTAVENVLLPMDYSGHLPPGQRVERAIALLAQVDMEDHIHRFPAELSGGQQQRVAIARALANEPPIIVADEPTGNLDSKTTVAIFDLFETLVAEGKTVLMVTHDQDLAERAARMIVLADGHIVEHGEGREADSPLKTGRDEGGEQDDGTDP